MTKTYRYLFALLALAVATGLVARLEGALIFTLYGYEVTLAMPIVVMLLACAGLALLGVVLIGVWAWRAPKRVYTHTQSNRATHRVAQGERAVVQGFMALARGDAARGAELANRAMARLPHSAMPIVLAAQAARMQNDDAQEEAHYCRLMEEADGVQDTLFGMEGLFRIALRNDAPHKARGLAEQALAKQSKCDWALDGLANMAAQNGDWDAARKLLARLARAGGQVADKQAVALVMLAEDKIRKTPHVSLRHTASNTKAGLALADKAVRKAPMVVAVRAYAARLHNEYGDRTHARKLLIDGWALAPHPWLADIWCACFEDAPAEARLRSVSALTRTNKGHLESYLLRARLACEARKYTLARRILKPLSTEAHPARRVCLAMADIEEAAGRVGPMREWRDRATRAAPEAQWQCRVTGRTFDDWLPICPDTGILNGLEWRRPDTALVSQ